MISHAQVLSDVTVATYAAHPYLNSCTSRKQHTLRHPHTYIFILHVHTLSAAQSTHGALTASSWLSFILSVVPCFLPLPLSLCVCLIFFTRGHKMMRKWRWVRGFIPECASMLATSLLAVGGLDHTLESIAQCWRLCLHPSSVPMKFRHF